MSKSKQQQPGMTETVQKHIQGISSWRNNGAKRALTAHYDSMYTDRNIPHCENCFFFHITIFDIHQRDYGFYPKENHHDCDHKTTFIFYIQFNLLKLEIHL